MAGCAIRDVFGFAAARRWHCSGKAISGSGIAFLVGVLSNCDAGMGAGITCAVEGAERGRTGQRREGIFRTIGGASGGGVVGG